MREKYSSENSKDFKCCLCCHVRVGTIILGLWHLAVHMLLLGCLVMATMNTSVLRDGMEPGTSMETDNLLKNGDTKYNTDSAEVEIQYETPSNSLWKLHRENMCFAFALVTVTFLITLLMVHGAVTSRPAQLMPFFCLQVFDFCLTCFTVVGYMTYAPDVKLWMVQQNMSTYISTERIMSMDERWLMLFFVIVFVLIVSIKAYLINMVWACYKYLQLRNANRSVVREYTTDPDAEMLLPPKYDEAMKMKGAMPAPPPYTA